MKILFAIGHPGFLRNFESGLRYLVAGEHVVHVHFGRDADADTVTGSALKVLDRLKAAGGALTTSTAHRPLSNEWSALASDLRMARDFWRYLARDYDDAPLLRERARSEAPVFAARIAESSLF